jgi:Ca2+-binding RTX toxin-like protein
MGLLKDGDDIAPRYAPPAIEAPPATAPLPTSPVPVPSRQFEPVVRDADQPTAWLQSFASATYVCGCTQCAGDRGAGEALRSTKVPSPNSGQAVVSDYSALISGQSWAGVDAPDTPQFITYSFETASQEYLREFGYSERFIAGFQAFTEQERENTRAALEKWASVSGIIFLEAEAGAGDIQFGKNDFGGESDLDDTAGFAFIPRVSLTGANASDWSPGGDIFIATSNAPGQLDDATVFYLMHEIGHAIGLKHPFEGDPTLITTLDNTDSTVMSYTGPAVINLGDLDVGAVRYLYGSQADDGSGLVSWNWNAQTSTLTRTLDNTTTIVRGVAARDVVNGGTNNNFLFGGEGDDTLSGGRGDDNLLGDIGIDDLIGGEGNDTLDGGAGFDRLWGGEGADRLRGGADGDTVDAGGGNDLALLGPSDDWGSGGQGDDTIDGSSGRDMLRGDDGNDVLIGGGGDDNLDGGAGRDLIIADANAAPIGFGSGFLELPRTAGNTNIINALNIGGNFTRNFSADSPLSAPSPHTTIRSAGEGPAQYFFISLEIGNTLHVDIDRTGGTFDSYIQILTINGEVLFDNDDAGNDPGSPDRTDSGLVFTAEYVGPYVIKVGTFDAENELAPGTRFDLTISVEEAGKNRDVLNGGAGDDTLRGGTGENTYVIDSYGDVIQRAPNSLNDSIMTTLNWTLADGFSGLELMGNVATHGTGNARDNGIGGNELGNVLSGLAGNDYLAGFGGSDTLNGGVGVDTMAGGLGGDVYFVDNPGDLILDLGDLGAVDTIFSSVSFVLTYGSEALILTGNAALNGDGSYVANRLTGNGASNRLRGLDGDDTLDGGGGIDRLEGGAGNDVYIIENAATSMIEAVNGGIDTVYSSVGRALYANVENMILTGTAALNADGNGLANVMTGNAAGNVLRGGDGNDTLRGMGGNDTLVAGTGIDRLEGGSGNDVYYVDNGATSMIEAADGGIDTVYSSVGRYLYANTEHMILTGTANLNVDGNASANRLTGNVAANLLRGGTGDDYLDGGLGSDTLAGGDGRDEMLAGNDAVRDVLLFYAVADSTGVTRDFLRNPDLNGEDRLDFHIVPRSIAAQVNVGALNEASFDADLARAIGAAQMGAGQAVLFDPSTGSSNSPGNVYLVVDANNVAGYQAGQDYVVQISGLLGTLTLDDFI